MTLFWNSIILSLLVGNAQQVKKKGGKRLKYSKLRGKIKEVFRTQALFAAKLGINAASLSSKLNGKSEWTESEILKACFLLCIPIKEVYLYFFEKEVGITQQGGGQNEQLTSF